MKNWWNARQPRERTLISVAGVVVIAILYFLLVWEPLVKANKDLQLQQQSAQALQTWLYSVEAEVTQLRKTSGKAGSRSQGSVLSVADTSARAAGLREAINRMQPDGDSTVRVWLENARFNPLLAWLHKLEQQQAIQVTDLNISRDKTPGHVQARLTLKR